MKLPLLLATLTKHHHRVHPLRRLHKTVLLLAALVLPVVHSSGRAQSPAQLPVPAHQASEARVIVKYTASSGLMQALSASGGAVRPQHAQVLSQRLGVALSNGRILGSRTQGLRGTGLSSAQLAARLAAQPDVEWAVPDERRTINALTNDPLLTGGQPVATPTVGQWYLRAPSGTVVSAINAVDAWDVTTGSANVTVAVLDTGVRLDHPDLIGKLRPGYDFVSSATIANDSDGRDMDASDPGDATNANECAAGTAASSSSWHGTQVAGLIGAATNNGFGMAGVGRNVMVLPVRVLGRCGGVDSDIVAAARWAAGLTSDVGSGVTFFNAYPAKVINMSFGSVGTCPPQYSDLIAELDAAGVTVVVAGGNDNGLAVNVPANCPGAVGVAGIRHVGSKVGYSNVGPEIAIAAPAGNCVNLVGTCLFPLLTTINAGTTVPTTNTFSDSSNATLGTSFSAPLVAGTVGLMLSVNPVLTPAQVKLVLQSSARVFPSTGGEAAAIACRAPNGVGQFECYCTTTTCGAGMLDAARAVAMASNPPAPVVVVAGGSGGGALGWGWLLGIAGAALGWRISRQRNSA